MAAYKEQLSRHVEGIFKGYTKPGLHICDIATGGGKSYTIGKLTCEYYPNEFDRIIILCWSEWPSSKSLQTINAGKGVEKREHSCTVGGNVN